jgi:hypothetical protein
MGIERHDAERRQDWVLRGFRQFDAPMSIVVTYDKELEGGCVAMGYPDDDFAANQVVSHRRPVAEVASFIGFDDGDPL